MPTANDLTQAQSRELKPPTMGMKTLGSTRYQAPRTPSIRYNAFQVSQINKNQVTWLDDGLVVVLTTWEEAFRAVFGAREGLRRTKYLLGRFPVWVFGHMLLSLSPHLG